MGLVIMRHYSIKLGGEAVHGAVFALRLGSGKDSASPLGVALPHWEWRFPTLRCRLRSSDALLLRCSDAEVLTDRVQLW